MTRKIAEWASEHGPITKIRPSDGCGKKFFSTAVGSVHHRIRFEDYLGNVGSDTFNSAANIASVEAGCIWTAGRWN